VCLQNKQDMETKIHCFCFRSIPDILHSLSSFSDEGFKFSFKVDNSSCLLGCLKGYVVLF
jgi:hypothetical protein